MTEVHERKHLKAEEDFPFVIEKMPITKGSYVEGELVEYDTTTHKLKKLAVAKNIFAVVTDNIDLAEDSATVYLTGIFNKKAITKNEALDDEEVRVAGIAKNIYIR
ncbi:MAG: hypothetical protein Q7K36_05215 [Fusobacterium sp. JB020]|nr:hypothetical protein [Fusobacterium sp. JB020]